ncbi:MAG: DUF6794 domain-containing protein [Cyclobacteriaceae bacterium]|jgi:hypothetical protein|nr:hypothetical protein [Flammeovirgaceae bacterium]
MRQIIQSIFFHLLIITAFGQGPSKADIKYKPKDLNDAILQLEKIHDDTTKQKILAMTEREFIANSHFGLGMWMRNNWGLWKGGVLAKHFNSMGIYHPDDMSGIILTSYYRHLNGHDRELEKQVKYYQDYWKASNEHSNRLKTDTSYQKEIRHRQDSFKTAFFNEKKLKWSSGKKVSGYIDKRCDFIKDFLLRTKVEGNIIEWRDEKLIIKVTKYYDERLKKRLVKCYKITDDILIVPDHELFRLEE